MPDDGEQRGGHDGTEAEPGNNAERVRPNEDATAQRERVERIEEHSEPPEGGRPTRDPG
jgi:hypothetical protein